MKLETAVQTVKEREGQESMPTPLLALFFQVYSIFVLENKINLVLYRNSEPGSGFLWGMRWSFSLASELLGKAAW